MSNDRALEVLRVYADVQGAGGTATYESVAKSLNCGIGVVRSAVTRLKELGVLEGERKLTVTQSGFDILDQPAADNEEAPGPVPPGPGHSTEAAAGATAPATVQRHTNTPAVRDPDRPAQSLSGELARQFLVDPKELMKIVQNNVINTGGGPPATREEVFHTLTVMKSLNLNPWTKQVHAFRTQGGKLAVMVGYDGWVALAKDDPGYIGAEYEYGPMVTSPDSKGRKCHEWVQCTLHSANRVPTVVTAYLDEWYVPQRSSPGPWQKHTKNRLRQKAYTMAVREHYGIGLMDEVDRDIVQDAGTYGDSVAMASGTEEATLSLKDRLAVNAETARGQGVALASANPNEVDADYDDLPDPPDTDEELDGPPPPDEPPTGDDDGEDDYREPTCDMCLKPISKVGPLSRIEIGNKTRMVCGLCQHGTEG